MKSLLKLSLFDIISYVQVFLIEYQFISIPRLVSKIGSKFCKGQEKNLETSLDLYLNNKRPIL